MMNRTRHFTIALTLSTFGLGIFSVGAQVAYADPETVRAEVGKPLQAAQELLKEKNYKAALAKLDEITVANKTPYETYVIDRTRAAIASVSGDDELALSSLQVVVASDRLSADEQLKFIEAIGDLYYRKADYSQAVTWITRYLKAGGGDPKEHDLLVRSYYLSNDFVHASQELQMALVAADKAGIAPTEEQLRILISLAVKQNDKPAYTAALEKFVVFYPKKEYWTDLLGRLQTKSTFSNRLTLDCYRLKFSMGLLSKANEFMEMAELSMLAGFPAEAKKIVEAGYKSGALGVGGELDHQKHLLDLATQNAAADLKTITQTEADVRKSKDGIGLINVGYVYVTNDQFDKGISLMEQGLSVGGLKHPDEAKLHLATAYVLAGRNQNAVQEFKMVQGNDGASDLARYWMTQLDHPIP